MDCDASGSQAPLPPLSQSPPSPSKKRRQPNPLRLGIDPSQIIGKVLTRIRRSPHHPTLTLDFADNTTFQVLIDGYDPIHRGIPKTLEMNSSLDPIFNPPEGQLSVDLLVADCASITLTDKAFERNTMENRWDQNHLGIAFKFGNEKRWHCIWATLSEYDENLGSCTFRSYDDVYLDRLNRSPRKYRSFNRQSRKSGAGGK